MMTETRRRSSYTLALMCAAAMAAACNLLNNDSTSPSTTTATSTETFSGTIDQNTPAVINFTVSQTGSVAVTLTSLSPSASTVVGMGIGTPTGTAGCTLTTSISSVVAGSTAQLTATANAGMYCVKVYDVGNLTGTATITVTVAHT